jgi:hypothetical protein
MLPTSLLASSRLPLLLTSRVCAQRRVGPNRSFSIVSATCESLVWAQQNSELPWWFVIATSSIALRSLVSLPLAVYQQHIIARLEMLKPEMKVWTDAIKYNVAARARRDNKSLEEAQKILSREVCNVAQTAFKLFRVEN